MGFIWSSKVSPKRSEGSHPFGRSLFPSRSRGEEEFLDPRIDRLETATSIA
jgi:hypothetical protein